MAPNIVLGFASLLTAGALLLAAVSFATDHWTEYVVNRSRLRESVATELTSSRAYYFSRNRGLFRECFGVQPNANETWWLDARADLLDGNCLPVEYELPFKETHTEYGDDYNTMIQLRRCSFAFLICGMLLLLIGCFLGAAGCWFMNASMLRANGIMVFFAAFFLAGSMAFFHGSEFLERDRVPIERLRTDAAVMADPVSSHFRLVWKDLHSGALERVTRYTYGWSYILGWLSMGLSAIAAIFYLCAAFSVLEKERMRDEKKRLPDDDRRPQRNRAYQYMDDDYKQGGPPQYNGAVPYHPGYGDPGYATGPVYPTGTYGYDYSGYGY